MATTTKQPKLFWHLSFIVPLVSLMLVFVAQVSLAQSGDADLGVVSAQNQNEVFVDQLDRSAGFFVLSDQSFDSQTIAKVRVEAQDLSAVEEYGGVDVVVYRVPQPIEFLKKQKNIHRVLIDTQAETPNLWFSIVSLWDKVAVESRKLWREVFSSNARQSTIDFDASLKTKPDFYTNRPVKRPPEYKPIPNLLMKERFRYPLQFAKNKQISDTQLTGANVDSSIEVGVLGNAYVPLGKLSPGLYVVEVMMGAQRALTLVFVSDTVVITKLAKDNLLAWAVQRNQGDPSSKVNVVWNDGIGVLAQGITNADGIVTLKHTAPEQTYVYGVDANGGVFISENYYYPSELHNTKVYITTDRPLYKSGDEVKVKVVAREFLNARDSRSVKNSPLLLKVLGHNANSLVSQTVLLENIGQKKREKNKYILFIF